MGYHGCLSQFNIHLRQQMKLVIFLLVVAVGLCTDYRKVLPKGSWQINIGEFDQVRGDILMAFGDYNLDGLYPIPHSAQISSQWTHSPAPSSPLTSGTTPITSSSAKS